MPKHPQWFVATVRPQHEAAVAHWFQDRGLEPFAPTYRVTRRWSDRTKVLDQALFPGYVFCRFARLDRVKVLNTPGVRSIVGFGGEPAVVPEEVIQQLTRMVTSGLPLQPWPYLHQGDRIRIDRGPLRGLEGLVVHLHKDCRLVVSVPLLQRSVSVSIDRDAITPLRAS